MAIATNIPKKVASLPYHGIGKERGIATFAAKRINFITASCCSQKKGTMTLMRCLSSFPGDHVSSNGVAARDRLSPPVGVPGVVKLSRLAD
jgi:hypothetical protein